MFKYIVTLFSILLSSVPAFASDEWVAEKTSSPHPVYTMQWSDRETLEYRSCGCADSCWKATLWDSSTQKRKMKVQLSCDCEVLFVKYSEIQKPVKYGDNCHKFEEVGKFDFIALEIKKILSDHELSIAR